MKSLNNGQKSLHPFIPNHRQYTGVDIMSEVLSACETFYQHKAMSHPKIVYEPYIGRHRSLLPEFLLHSFLDKSPQVPIVACAKFWTSTHHKSFLSSPRYKEMARYTNEHDTSFSNLWYLTDSLSLSVFREQGRGAQGAPRNLDMAALLHGQFSSPRKRFFEGTEWLKNRLYGQIYWSVADLPSRTAAAAAELRSGPALAPR